ncbi:hypothetical protein M3Y97_00656300 [Aphelenchoides bicaudatus]|nr:hypothetical protein M3Y97_00656300 [Aphelenchoides bicaudatus]
MQAKKLAITLLPLDLTKQSLLKSIATTTKVLPTTTSSTPKSASVELNYADWSKSGESTTASASTQHPPTTQTYLQKVRQQAQTASTRRPKPYLTSHAKYDTEASTRAPITKSPLKSLARVEDAYGATPKIQPAFAKKSKLAGQAPQQNYRPYSLPSGQQKSSQSYQTKNNYGNAAQVPKRNYVQQQKQQLPPRRIRPQQQSYQPKRPSYQAQRPQLPQRPQQTGYFDRKPSYSRVQNSGLQQQQRNSQYRRQPPPSTSNYGHQPNRLPAGGNVQQKHQWATMKQQPKSHKVMAKQAEDKATKKDNHSQRVPTSNIDQMYKLELIDSKRPQGESYGQQKPRRIIDHGALVLPEQRKSNYQVIQHGYGSARQTPPPRQSWNSATMRTAMNPYRSKQTSRPNYSQQQSYPQQQYRNSASWPSQPKKSHNQYAPQTNTYQTRTPYRQPSSQNYQHQQSPRSSYNRPVSTYQNQQPSGQFGWFSNQNSQQQRPYSRLSTNNYQQKNQYPSRNYNRPSSQYFSQRRPVSPPNYNQYSTRRPVSPPQLYQRRTFMPRDYSRSGYGRPSAYFERQPPGYMFFNMF